MQEKSLLDYAYEYLSKKNDAVQFKELFDIVVTESGIKFEGDELKVRMSKFYTQLSLDGRFVTLTDNYWDLRSRHKFSQVHINMDDAYSDEEEGTDDEEEEKLLKAELGEDDDLKDAVVASSEDDEDFDKPKKSREDEEGF